MPVPVSTLAASPWGWTGAPSWPRVAKPSTVPVPLSRCRERAGARPRQHPPRRRPGAGQSPPLTVPGGACPSRQHPPRVALGLDRAPSPRRGPSIAPVQPSCGQGRPERARLPVSPRPVWRWRWTEAVPSRATEPSTVPVQPSCGPRCRDRPVPSAVAGPPPGRPAPIPCCRSNRRLLARSQSPHGLS